MADKLMYIPNVDTQNYPYCRLQLIVETFEYSTKWTNQSKFNKSLQKSEANEKENVIIKFWVIV